MANGAESHIRCSTNTYHHITNIAPYVIDIAVGRQLFPFLGFELLKTTSDDLKAVIWQRFEECCQVTSSSFIEGDDDLNDPGMEDSLEFIPEGWIGGVKICENVFTISSTANRLVGEDYFLYSNNVEDVFLGDKFAPLMAIIPAFGSTLAIEYTIFSYEPETMLYCELNDFSLNYFNFLILNAKSEPILVKALIDLQFRLIKK